MVTLAQPAVTTTRWKAVSDGAVLFSGLFLILYVAKLFVISRYAGVMPFEDEWDAGAASLYGQYILGELSFADLVAAHNEHRITTSRILGLIVFELAGEWNPKVLMVVNAAIHAGFLTWFVQLLFRAAPAWGRAGFLVFSTLIFCVPVGHENTIMGMNAHFYFLVLLSIAALKVAMAGNAFSPAWFGALLLMLLGYLSMASGALTPFAAAFVHVCQMLFSSRRRNPREIAGLVVLLAVGVVLFWTGPFRPEDRFRADGFFEFLSAFVRVSVAPLPDFPGLFLLVQGPAIAFFVYVLGQRPKLSDVSWFIVAVSVWAAAQMASIAYARAPIASSPRYQDLLIVMAPINLCVLLWLLDRLGRFRLVGAISAIGYLALLLGPVNADAFGALKRHKSRLDNRTAHVGEFMKTGDVEAFKSRPRWVPYPDADRVAAILSRSEIRSILPAELRPADADIESAREHMVLNGRFAGATRSATEFLLRSWLVLACLGVILMLTGSIRALRQMKPGAEQ